MSNILITGINGFLGSATAKYFLNKGHHIIGLVRDRNLKTRPEILERCSIIQGDILDKQLIMSTISKYEAEYILHLACQPIVRICDNDPYTAYTTNIVGTLNVLEAVRTLKKPPKKVVAISSDKAYGPQTELPYKEDSPLVTADSYCTSKSCQDMIIRSYAKTYNLPIVCVRAGNIYGPGDMNLSRLVPNTIRKFLRHESAFLYTGVANYVREFIYVTDIVRAFETLFEKGIPGEAYNVGGTPPQRILNVVETIRNKIYPTGVIDLIEKNFDEIPEQYLDATKLCSLGWSSKVDLNEGLDKAIKWYSTLKN
jgi:CDP-glucose 4,6-dehydratase